MSLSARRGRDMIGNFGRASVDGQLTSTTLEGRRRRDRRNSSTSAVTGRPPAAPRSTAPLELCADEPAVVVATHVDHAGTSPRADDRSNAVRGTAAPRRRRPWPPAAAILDRGLEHGQPCGVGVGMSRRAPGASRAPTGAGSPVDRPPPTNQHRTGAEAGEHDAGLPRLAQDDVELYRARWRMSARTTTTMSWARIRSRSGPGLSEAEDDSTRVSHGRSSNVA
jgi:hypothetical protein